MYKFIQIDKYYINPDELVSISRVDDEVRLAFINKIEYVDVNYNVLINLLRNSGWKLFTVEDKYYIFDNILFAENQNVHYRVGLADGWVVYAKPEEIEICLLL